MFSAATYILKCHFQIFHIWLSDDGSLIGSKVTSGDKLILPATAMVQYPRRQLNCS